MRTVEESIRARDVNNLGLYEAHKFSRRHRASIERRAICGCFYCVEVFNPKHVYIKEWIDGGTTALCPLCGIDSVLSTVDEPRAADEHFLQAMHDAWFSACREDGTDLS